MLWTNLPAHFFTYGSLLGATLYQSFFAGLTARKALPLEMFSRLQHRIFPGFFCIQTVLSLALFATTPFKVEGKVLYSLAATLGTAAINWFIILPKTSRIGQLRLAQVEREGKAYNDPTASDEMKVLNRAFKKIHAFSMSFALCTVIAELIYGAHFVNHLTLV